MLFIGTFYGIDFFKIKIHFQKCLHVLSKRSKQIKLDSLVIFFQERVYCRPIQLELVLICARQMVDFSYVTLLKHKLLFIDTVFFTHRTFKPFSLHSM